MKEIISVISIPDKMTVHSLFENSRPRKEIFFRIRTEHHEIRLFTKIDLLPELVVTFRHLELITYLRLFTNTFCFLTVQPCNVFFLSECVIRFHFIKSASEL